MRTAGVPTTRRTPQFVRLGVVAVLLLTTAACGARWNEEQAASVQARYDDDGGSGGGDDVHADSAASRDRSTTTDGSSGGEPQNAAGGNGGNGGNGGSGGSGGQGGSGQGGQGGDGGPAQAAGGPLPCTQPSDAPGVTDSEINLGAISTLSGPVPGIGESALSAIRAYAEFRNATGGVCGRQLTIQSEDDGLDNARFRSILGDFDSQVLGIAGGVSGGDAGGTDVIDQLQIPMVGTFVSTSFETAQWAFDTNPPFEDVNQPIPKYEYLVDQGVETAAVVTIALDQARSEARKQKAQMQASGIEIVNDQELPLSTLSFDSAARGVANSGADYLLFIYDPGNSAAMAQSMEGTDADLLFEEYLTAYGSNFIERAGQQAAEGATSWARFVPNEEPGTSEGQTNFLEWMERTAPGIDRDNFAVDGWAATYALVRAIETVPGPITRQAVFDQLRMFTDFDANGLIGPINLGQERNQGCFVAMRVQGGSWTRLTPGQGFSC